MEKERKCPDAYESVEFVIQRMNFLKINLNSLLIRQITIFSVHPSYHLQNIKKPRKTKSIKFCSRLQVRGIYLC